MDTELEQSDKYAMYESSSCHVLEIRDVTEADEGTYSCVISNSLGTEICDAELAVFGSHKPPVPSSAPAAADSRAAMFIQPFRRRSDVTSSTVMKQFSLTSSPSCADAEAGTATGEQTPDAVKPVVIEAVCVNGEGPLSLHEVSDAAARRRSFQGCVQPEIHQDSVKSADSLTANTTLGVRALSEPPDLSLHTVSEPSVTTSQSSKSGEVALPVSDSSVFLPPSFDIKPKSASVIEGDLVRFSCHVHGQPAPDVTWEKDGKPIGYMKDRCQMSIGADGTCTLEVHNVIQSDAGRYICIAKNVVAEARCTCTMIVRQAAFRQLRAPAPKKLNGSVFVFNDAASVTNPPTKIRTANEVVKTDKVTVADKIIKLSDTVANHNTQSETSEKNTESHCTTVAIEIGGQPKFSDLKSHARFVPKQAAVTSLDIDKDMSFENVQTNETVVLPAVEAPREVVSTNSVTLDHTVQVTPESRTVDKSSSPPTEQSSQSPMFFHDSSNSASLPLAPCDPETQLENNQEVTPDGKCCLEPEMSDKIQDPDDPVPTSESLPSEDLKTETVIADVNCTVSDSDKCVSSLNDSAAIKDLTLDESPQFDSVELPDVMAQVSDSQPNEDQLSTTNDSCPCSPDVTTSPLCRPGDDGDYQRILGERIEPPIIYDLLPENVHIFHGKSLQLTAQFTGYPVPSVSWYRGADKLEDGDRYSMTVEPNQAMFTIERTEPSDTGCYAIELINIHGSERMYSSVTIEDCPDPPVGQPAVTSVKRSSVVLSWYGCSYDGGSPIIGYKVELLHAGRESTGVWKMVTDACPHTTYQVQNLQPNTEYQFRVSSVNRHGFSSPGLPSDVVVTIDQPTLKFVKREKHRPCNINIVMDSELSPQMLNGPLSPETLMAIRDELPFEPREVKIIPGRKFSDFFTVGEEIGKGKFGNVCMCKEKETNRSFAAKFIRVKAGQREEFKQEIAVMNELRHPKILLLWDAFESARELILVMEHVGGRELLERIISDDYMLTEKECIHFMSQICEGVRYMHSRLILHLDLKPENILCITPNGNEIKLIDFGLARKFDPKKSFRVLFGTPEFVAPEVINYDDIGFTTDMWSVGVICYLLLSGLSPFSGDNDKETLANVTEAEYDFDAEEFEEISDTAKDFISKLLIKAPKKRMLADQCLLHEWLSQDVTYMRAKRLSTSKHKRFMAKRKWQKTGNALKALNRMTFFQRSSASNLLSRSTISSSGHGGSINSDPPGPLKSSAGTDLASAMHKSRSLDLGAALSKLNVHTESSDRPDSGIQLETPVDSSRTSRSAEILDLTGPALLVDRSEECNPSIDDPDLTPVVLTETAGVSISAEKTVVTDNEITEETHNPSCGDVIETEPLELKTVPSITSEEVGCVHSETSDAVESKSKGTEPHPATKAKPTLAKKPSNTVSRKSEPLTGTKTFGAVTAKPHPTTAAPVCRPVSQKDSSTVGKPDPVKRRVFDGADFLTNSRTPPAKPKRPPMFVRKMRNVNVVEGESARFEVIVDGNPPPTVIWLKDGIEIVPDSVKYCVEPQPTRTTPAPPDDGKWSLVITDCGEDDDAEYGCRATSTLGKIASKAELYVEPAGAGEE